MTRIVCVSDLHENLVEIPECDVLMIAGDLSYAFKGDLPAKQKFLVGPFAEWAQRVPAKEVVFVAGNHDQSIEKWGWPLNLPHVHYLQDEGKDVLGLNVWGTPWQPWFYSWAFNAPRNYGEDFLAEKFSHIPAGTDVIICHGPPYGYGDSVGNPNVPDRSRQPRVGSVALLDAIDRVKPKLVVAGHIHSGRGTWQRGETMIVNATVVNDKYRAVYAPIVVDL